MKYREMYLTEKCINTLIKDYREGSTDGYHSAKQDFCIAFLNFLNENEKEYVTYGIDYIEKNYPKEVEECLIPILLEYQHSGIEGDLHWDDVPDKHQTQTNPIKFREVTGDECAVNEEVCTKDEIYEINKDDCTVKEKIMLFVMRLLNIGEK